VKGKQRLVLPIVRAAIWRLRNSRSARQHLVRWQMRFTPEFMLIYSKNTNQTWWFLPPTAGVMTVICCVKRRKEK